MLGNACVPACAPPGRVDLQSVWSPPQRFSLHFSQLPAAGCWQGCCGRSHRRLLPFLLVNISLRSRGRERTTNLLESRPSRGRMWRSGPLAACSLGAAGLVDSEGPMVPTGQRGLRLGWGHGSCLSAAGPRTPWFTLHPEHPGGNEQKQAVTAGPVRTPMGPQDE